MNYYKANININRDAERIAGAVLSSLGPGNETIRNFIGWIEKNLDCKIIFSFWNFSSKMCSGFVYSEKKSSGELLYHIHVNNSELPYRQRFTVCHELAHILQLSGFKYGFMQEDIYSASGIERFCNRFAAAFLMPAADFVEIWEKVNE